MLKKKYLLSIFSIATVFAAFSFGFMLSSFLTPECPNKACEYVDKLSKTSKAFQRYVKSEKTLDFLRRGGQYFPDYENPRTFNDKIGYILYKYFQRSLITTCIGTKYYAKKYIADIIGEDHVVKLLGVWDNPKDIEWDKLPNRFVLKTARGHRGEQVILIKDKTKINISKITKKLEDLCKNIGMQWVTQKRIIAEEYLEQHNGEPVSDYKFFFSYGKPIVAYCLTNPNSETCNVNCKTCSFYSIPEWKRLQILIDEDEPNSLSKPKHLSKMIELSEKLSKPFPLIRIDFYEVGDRVLVGELTEDSNGAKYIFSPVIWDFKLGEMIDIPSLDEIEKMIENDKKIYKKYVGDDMK